MSLRVSVVVPTFRRPELLRRCLEGLSMQEYPFGDYEVIVVDDAGCEETKRLVEEYSGRPKEAAAAGESWGALGTPRAVRYLLAADTRGPAAARNLGWQAARGEIIAFTDDDCLPKPDWLKKGVMALAEGLDGASGRVIVPIPGEPTDYERNAAMLTRAEFVTANCFYRRAALEAVGGFDERFEIAWREDSELFFRMLEHSYRLGYADEARVVHPVRPAGWGVSLKEQRKSLYNALLFKKHPQLYRTRIQPRPPLRYYLIVISAFATLTALLLGWTGAAIVAGMAWLMLTLQLALRRLSDTRRSPGHVLEMLVTSLLIPMLSVYWRLVGAFRYRVLFF